MDNTALCENIIETEEVEKKPADHMGCSRNGIDVRGQRTIDPGVEEKVGAGCGGGVEEEDKHPNERGEYDAPNNTDQTSSSTVVISPSTLFSMGNLERKRNCENICEEPAMHVPKAVKDSEEENRERDECDDFGDYIASELRKITNPVMRRTVMLEMLELLIKFKSYALSADEE